MHALLISATAAYLCLFAPELADGPDQPYMLRTSRLSTAALGFSAGYFALDLYFVLRHFPLVGDWLIAVGCYECTTPFVNARWLLDRAGYREAGVYVANGMALLAAWVVGRLLLFLFYFSHVWDHRAEIALVSRTIAAFTWVMPALLFALNIFWFVKILRGAARMREDKIGGPSMGRPALLTLAWCIAIAGASLSRAWELQRDVQAAPGVTDRTIAVDGTAAGGVPTTAPAAPAPSCPLAEGQLVRCAADGSIFMHASGQLLQFSPPAWAQSKLAQPADVDCAPLFSCPRGPVLYPSNLYLIQKFLPATGAPDCDALKEGQFLRCPSGDILLFAFGALRQFSPAAWALAKVPQPASVDCGSIDACPRGTVLYPDNLAEVQAFLPAGVVAPTPAPTCASLKEGQFLRCTTGEIYVFAFGALRQFSSAAWALAKVPQPADVDCGGLGVCPVGVVLYPDNLAEVQAFLPVKVPAVVRPPPPPPAPVAFPFTGDGTAYGDGRRVVPNSGSDFSCAFPYLNNWASEAYAAINSAQYAAGARAGRAHGRHAIGRPDTTGAAGAGGAAEARHGAHCGRCALVRCVDRRCKVQNKAVKVYLTDECPTCRRGMQRGGRGTGGGVGLGGWGVGVSYGDVDLSVPAFKAVTGLSPDRVKIQWTFTSCSPEISGRIMWQAFYFSNSAQPLKTVTVGGKALSRSPYGFWVRSAGFLDLAARTTFVLTGIDGTVVTAAAANLTRPQSLGVQFRPDA
eukprot:scaffold2.g6892.t1